MEKLESTLPGLKYPAGRDDFLQTGHGFIEGRKIDDGAEGLWRIRNGLYDLEKWVEIHPGGSEWITLTKGTDITEAFETHHLTDKAENLLPKFYVREAVTSRSVPLTFFHDGFYQKFKRRAANALKDVDFHRPAQQTNLIADCLAATTIFSCLLATRFWIATLIGGVLLAWTATVGHNYLHARDNFRMCYMDLCFLSTKEWRITHVMSHHMYTNTIWDHEVYAVEQFFHWLPTKNKSRIRGYISVLIAPLVYALASLFQGFKRYYLVFYVWKKSEFRDYIPFIPPILMYLVAPTFATAIRTWMSIILLSSFVFHFVGFNAGHHHPDIFHDGDICRKNLDWGLLALDAVRGRKGVDDSLFLSLTNFGSHTLHHLLPTVDHAYLPLCMDAYRETCKEFGINSDDRMTQWEHVKGQFQQLVRVESKYNTR